MSLLHGINVTQGIICVNGTPMDKITDWYITNTGYVLQLTAPYYEELTVRENILLAALMRLPWNISNRERFKRIEQVITEVKRTSFFCHDHHYTDWTDKLG